MAASTITGVAYALGTETVSQEQLSERFGEAAMQKVLSGSGIRSRRIAAEGVCGSDLAFDAAETLLARQAVDRQSIDLLIHCTQTPDYLMPTTACLLQERLKLPTRCAAFDINLGCSQYVYALSVAHSMIAAGVAHRALVLTGDTMSRTVNELDRALVPIIGDAGSATLVEPPADGGGFLGFELGTDGSGAKYLIMPASGFRRRRSAQTCIAEPDSEGSSRSAENMYMHGAAVFQFVITTVPKTIQSLLGRLNLAMEDVDLFLFHQPNKFILDYLIKKLKIGPEKTHIFVEEIGNTSGSALPVVLAEAMAAGKVKPGARVLLMSFGVGLSWGATLWQA